MHGSTIRRFSYSLISTVPSFYVKSARYIGLLPIRKSAHIMKKELYESSCRIGHLYPVLLDKHGNVLDGNHRLNVDRNWEKIKLNHIDNEKDAILVKIISNNVRRQVTAREKRELLGKLAEIYLTEGIMPGDLMYKIAQETGMSYQWVTKYVPSKFKDRTHAENASLAPRRGTKTPNFDNIDLSVKLYRNANFVNVVLKKTLFDRIEKVARAADMTAEELLYASIIQIVNGFKKREKAQVAV
jgi:hypothetical protein